MYRLSTIELFKEEMSFSAGHFTVFSAENRENLHGHNYCIHASCTTLIGDEGYTFDYRFYKTKFKALCKELNQAVLMAGNCKYLKIEDAGDYWHVYFAQEKMVFLKRDLKILPVTNITVEELSHYMMQQFLADQDELEKNKIQEVQIKVFSGPGQSGSATWRRIDV